MSVYTSVSKADDKELSMKRRNTEAQGTEMQAKKVEHGSLAEKKIVEVLK